MKLRGRLQHRRLLHHHDHRRRRLHHRRLLHHHHHRRRRLHHRRLLHHHHHHRRRRRRHQLPVTAEIKKADVSGQLTSAKRQPPACKKETNDVENTAQSSTESRRFFHHTPRALVGSPSRRRHPDTGRAARSAPYWPASKPRESTCLHKRPRQGAMIRSFRILAEVAE